MSIVSSLPLTKLKRQAQNRQRSLKSKQEEYQKRHQTIRNSMASKIQRTWRRYAIHKQHIQQQIIKRLLNDIGRIAGEAAGIQDNNRLLKRHIKELEDDFQNAVDRQKTRQQERVEGVFKKAFNSIVSHEIEHRYVEEQLGMCKENSRECQRVLQELIECTLALQGEEEEMLGKEREYGLRVKELQQKIMKQTLQLNSLQFQYQELGCKRRKMQIERRFREYLE